jgi:hypothetical protein
MFKFIVIRVVIKGLVVRVIVIGVLFALFIPQGFRIYNSRSLIALRD